jgi:uncharacterized protein YgiM (DUF1202 family)
MTDKNIFKQRTRLIFWAVFFAVIFAACSFEDLINYDPYAALERPASRSPTSTTEPTATATAPICRVTAQESLNLRDGPGMSYEVIYWLKAGDVLTITNEPSADVWIQVTTETRVTGWINSNFCKEK